MTLLRNLKPAMLKHSAKAIISELWSLNKHRRFITSSAWTLFRNRYGGTVLGNFWHVSGPLVLIAIYSIVFTSLMPVDVPGLRPASGFLLYLSSGMMLWLTFSDGLTRTSSALLDNAQYVRKLALPEIVFVGQAAVATIIIGAISMGLLVILALGLGLSPDWSWFSIVPLMLLTIAFAASLGLLLAPLAALLQDVTQVLPIVLQVWFWLTPIIYIRARLPEKFRAIIDWNPLTLFVDALHGIILHNDSPSLRIWASIILLDAVVLLCGVAVLHRLRSAVRDVL